MGRTIRRMRRAIPRLTGSVRKDNKMKTRRTRVGRAVCPRLVSSNCRIVGLLGMIAIVSGCVVSRTFPPQPPSWALQKITDGRDADTMIQDTNCTACLKQLSAPLGPCHIDVVDLPAQYRQSADEKRLDYVVSAGAKKAELEARYPVLRNYLSVSRAWVSEDKKTIAFLMYHSLGDFIVLSQDGGAHWSSPLYLGIHRLPEAWYAPLADSKLPLVSNGNIQIEVTIWKRDKTQDGSPLLGYKYLWKKWNKYLSVRLDDLRRDTDGDGLTDLFEERIITDSRSPDTDKDGLSDSVDNQPLTPFPKKMTNSDAVVLSLIAADRGPLLGSIFPSWRAPKDLSAFDHDSMSRSLTKEGVAYFTESQSEAITMDRTSVVVSSGDSFPRITGAVRVVVLDENAFRMYTNKFPEESHLYAGSFDLRFDRSRNVAMLKQFEGNTGSTTVLWKQRGRWQSSEKEHIICD